MFEQGLYSVDNQKVSFNINENLFICSLYPFNDIMYMDVTMNHEDVVCGMRLLPNTWILPSHFGINYGNFRFETSAADKDQYVNSNGLGDMFKLIVYLPKEFEDELGN